MAKLWGGRFSESENELAARLNNSSAFDWRLAPQDVKGSLAWARALHKAGILSAEETDEIAKGLEQIRAEIAAGSLVPHPQDEDVHSTIERRLGEIIGATAGKLHTGRSRNDQVMTDFNLWLKEAVSLLKMNVHNLQHRLIVSAKEAQTTIFPGYTHFQRAQPVLLAHWWLSHFWPLQRDQELLTMVFRQADVLVLGSGALAGTSFPIDRHALMDELGFSTLSQNSIDAVSNRDAAASFLFAGAMISMHLSRLAEALILFSTTEYGFFELSDAFSTGSSLMPQKKNPDPLELVRAKAGTVNGRLAGFLSVLKGLPSAYDKDLQEDKPAVFEVFDILSLTLPVIEAVLASLHVNAERMRAAVDETMLMTDLADYLVLKGVPFRQAHYIIGQLVQKVNKTGHTTSQLSIEELKALHPAFDEDVRAIFDPLRSINLKTAPGGTAFIALNDQILQAELTLSS